MAKLWLALLLVAALGTVDPAISTIDGKYNNSFNVKRSDLHTDVIILHTVTDIRDAWTEFNVDLNSCDPQCPSDFVNGAVNEADDNDIPSLLCVTIKGYTDCANKNAVCSSLDTQKLNDLCSTVTTTTTAKTTTDGCSILQLSILVLTLSLLLSII